MTLCPCPFCTAPTRTTRADGYTQHDRADTHPSPVCPASGKTPSQVHTMLHTFHHWEHRAHDLTRTTEIIDNGDSITLANAVTLTHGTDSDRIAEVSVRIPPEQTRDFIAKLTAIADDRGL